MYCMQEKKVGFPRENIYRFKSVAIDLTIISPDEYYKSIMIIISYLEMLWKFITEQQLYFIQ